MNVAIRFKGERHVLQLPAAATIQQLQQEVQQLTQLPPSQQLLRWGYPLQRMQTEGAQQQRLTDVGCTSGQLILVEATEQGRPPPPTFSAAAPHACREQHISPTAGASPPLQQQQPQQQLQQVEGEEKDEELRTAAAADADELDELTLRALAAAEAAAARAPRPPVCRVPSATAAGGYRFVRVSVPADDSCLFASVSLVAIPSLSASQLRDLAAAGLAKDRERFNEVVLEAPPAAYVRRLRAASTWGGYLELTVLAEQLQQQLAVVDAESGRMDIYGEKYKHRRSFLLYDGIHYDPLMGAPPGAPEAAPGAPPPPVTACSHLQTVFAADDAAATAAAAAVGREVQQQQGFVRAAGMQARCLVCGQLLRDNKELRQHAKATGHQNFAHIQHCVGAALEGEEVACRRACPPQMRLSALLQHTACCCLFNPNPACNSSSEHCLPSSR
ncbi:hypothetical protein Efla_002189 [Eimeria flavescens]